MKLSIIIPCYNEAETIGEIVARVQNTQLPDSWAREIIIVDDGSGEETKKAISDIGNVHVITRTKNGGKGAALKDGLRQASGDYILIQDADLEYDPADIPKLLASIISGRTRVVFGSRNLTDNNVPGRFFYYWGGRAVNDVFNMCFGTKFTDLSTCYKVFPRSSIPTLLEQPSNNFVFDVIELSAVLAREHIIEIPISYKARDAEHGKKLKASDGIKCTMRIFQLRFGAYARIFRFIIVGGTAAAVNVGVLYTLTHFAGLWYIASEAVAFIVALCYNFSLQKFWTFAEKKKADGTEGKNAGARVRTRGAAARQGLLFILINLMNLGLNTLMLYLLVEFFGVWYILAQCIASVIIAFESYLLYRSIF